MDAGNGAERCPAAKVTSCPFLRSISVGTDFNLWGKGGQHSRAEDGVAGRPADLKGPIFADGLTFEMAFKAFHGEQGVVPLSRALEEEGKSVFSVGSVAELEESKPAAFSGASAPALVSCPALTASNGQAKHRLVESDESLENSGMGGSVAEAFAAAPFATIGLSGLGGAGGFFGFDAFRDAMESRKERERRDADESRKRKEEQHQHEQAKDSQGDSKPHEALGDDWLATGNCPIARSYRAFNRVVPAMAAAFKPPAGVKYVCPPAIVAMRAAVAKHPFMKSLRPQALPIKVLAIGTMGLFLNIPLGAWRQHLVKFSPQWILVVHASVPFVAILRKAALIPKYAMAFTIAASIVGQAIGAKLEKKRIAAASPLNQSHDIAPATSLVVKQRRARRQDLGHGIRGLGLQRTDSVVAYDCQMSEVDMSVRNQASHTPSNGQPNSLIAPNGAVSVAA